MRRREFITAIACSTIAWPVAAGAQGTQKVRRVGVFFGSSKENDGEAKLRANILQSVLQTLAWTEGANIRFDYRFSASDRLLMDAHVAELIGLAPDVIVVRGNRPVTLIKQATRTLPVVFAQVGDPVGSGIVDNLGRPGGNITGFTHFEATMGGKWLEALKEVAPSLRHATILMSPDTPANIAFLRAAEGAAPALGVTLAAADVRNATDIERAIPAAAGVNAGLVVLPHDVTVGNDKLIVALATQYGLPAVYPYRFSVTQGGLISYSFDIADHWRQVATYVDRILRGEKPANLPVQAPTKFLLVINLKTAKALSLDVSPQLLARADEVIE
jgi:putative tryptophan/tyrosine transport system substrate-binding protein